jgi:predicted phosphodiesterase
MNRLIELPEKGKVVIVGDTHGDYIASRIIVKNFINKKNHYIIFLGDYVDRGEKSKENIDFLLSAREKYPNIFLLAGNHEMFPLKQCSPANFWENLNKSEYCQYKEVLLNLPYAAAGKGFIALHGALPDIKNVAEINDIQPQSDNWYKMLWGDFRERPGENLGSFLGRARFGRDYFHRVMKTIGKNVLVRSHDPLARENMFGGKCLTIFTTMVYRQNRKIAIGNLDKEIQNVNDFEIMSLDAP